jgi:hypothetical protein
MKTLVVTLVVALEVDAVSWKPARGMRQVWKWESSGIERWNRRQKAIAYRQRSRRVDDEPKSQRGNTARQERPRERENKLSRTTKLRPLKSQQ